MGWKAKVGNTSSTLRTIGVTQAISQQNSQVLQGPRAFSCNHIIYQESLVIWSLFVFTATVCENSIKTRHPHNTLRPVGSFQNQNTLMIYGDFTDTTLDFFVSQDSFIQAVDCPTSLLCGSMFKKDKLKRQQEPMEWRERTLAKLLDIMDNANPPLHTVINKQGSLFSDRLLLL